jgi:hypothetical protein
MTILYGVYEKNELIFCAETFDEALDYCINPLITIKPLFTNKSL